MKLQPPDSTRRRVLKQDHFGRVELRAAGDQPDSALFIRRDLTAAPWWARPLARHLARREARVLSALDGVAGVPVLQRWDGTYLERSYLEGEPMHIARPTGRAYFCAARALLARLHRLGVVHNDAAKEPNWLVLNDGAPALIDFQLALWWPRRGRFFRTLAREDLRHLLKHKRTYLGDRLTRRERHILAHRAWPSALWMRTIKPLYMFVTRRLIGWSDREGAGDRGAR